MDRSPPLRDFPSQIATLELLAATPPLISYLWVKRLSWLAVIITVNCLLLAAAEGVAFLLLTADRTSATYDNGTFGPKLCMGIMTAQFLLAGFWCALSPEKLSFRVAVGTLFAGLLLGTHFVSLWCANNLSALGRYADEAGMYCGLAVIALLMLRALRPWCGWRLAWDEFSAVEKRQFRILDLMAWTAAVAISLGLMQSLNGPQTLPHVASSLILIVVALPVIIPAVRWAVAANRHSIWLACFLTWSVVYPFVIFAVLIQVIGTARLPNWMTCLEEVAVGATLHVSFALVWVGNVLVMRRIGLRIWKTRASPETQSAGNT